jgi:hypothetical protein
MTHDMNKQNEVDGTLPDALRWELRALRRDAAPDRDLWPSIAQRLAATPQIAPAPVVARRKWRIAPLATAASLALALGIAWQLRPIETPVPGRPAANDPHGQLITREADAMTLEYQAALRELNAGRPPQARPAAVAPEIKLLDRSAAQIRTALTRDPEARFLLNQLQRTYTRRLELTERLAAAPDPRIAS